MLPMSPLILPAAWKVNFHDLASVDNAGDTWDYLLFLYAERTVS